MRKFYCTLLGLSLLFGGVSCSKEDISNGIDKAKIEAERIAKEKLKEEAIKSLKGVSDLATLKSVFEALSKELQNNEAIKKVMEEKKAELEKQAMELAKQEAIKALEGAKDLKALKAAFEALGKDVQADEAVKKAMEAKKAELEKIALEQAKKEAIKALNEAKDLKALKAVFDGLAKEVQADEAVKQAMEAKKTELKKKAEEAEASAKWLEGKTFVWKRVDEEMEVTTVRTIIFKENFTYHMTFQMGAEGFFDDMAEPVDGSYRYKKPTLKLKATLDSHTSGDSYSDFTKEEVSAEYTVDEEKGTLTGIIDDETIVLKLQK